VSRNAFWCIQVVKCRCTIFHAREVGAVSIKSAPGRLTPNLCDRAGVPDLSLSGDNFDLVEDDPHDPTTMSKPEAPMQSLNQLPVATNLVDARSA
jgi:hypothetical protein